MARLSGRAAIVTGGAKGIGRHYSRALAAEGARVMIADIADGKELAQEIAAEHGANSVASAVADVSDEARIPVTSRPRASAPCSRVRCGATSIPRTCWARWFSWRRRKAISSPGRRSRSTAAT